MAIPATDLGARQLRLRPEAPAANARDREERQRALVLDHRRSSVPGWFVGPIDRAWRPFTLPGVEGDRLGIFGGWRLLVKGPPAPPVSRMLDHLRGSRVTRVDG